jgi:protein O-GlcNAc transferase
VINFSVDDFVHLKLDEALKLAKKKLNEGFPDESKCIYRDILRRFPANKKAKSGLKALSCGPVGEGQISRDLSQDQQQFLIGLYAQGELQQVLDQTKIFLEQFPYSILLHNIRGAVYAAFNQYDSAIDSYTQALQIKPDYAEALYNMGNALLKKGEVDAAIDSYTQALKIKPDYAEAHNNIGGVQLKNGELDAAIGSYKQALQINPDCQPTRSLKLYSQAHICDWAAIQVDQDLFSKLGTTTQYIDPFSILSLEDAPERHKLRSEIYVKKTFPQKPLPLGLKPLQKPKRLRIGYFSADFHNHATMYLMGKVFEAHDPEKFEIYAYSFGPDKNDELRQRLIKAVDVFDDVTNVSDEDAALLARQDKIDIAVDLKGYTQNARPGIFAYRAAPLQISYLGYPGTMGADFIDYIIADNVVITEHHEEHYTENVIYLPNSYQANDNTRRISERLVTRSEVGLPEQGFVFCCFNNNYKITPSEFDIWMRVLGMVEGSVLWLLKSNKWAEINLQLEAESRGIPRNRLIFAVKLPQDEHLARQQLADLFLDTFNYNAHTTASDALWSGLPVVTKIGKGFAARVAGSLLTAIGLPELVTETEQEYEALILDLATDPERLASLKDKLAANRFSKPLFDTELFTKHLEDSYQQVYHRYFENLKFDTINVCDN